MHVTRTPLKTCFSPPLRYIPETLTSNLSLLGAFGQAYCQRGLVHRPARWLRFEREAGKKKACRIRSHPVWRNLRVAFVRASSGKKCTWSLSSVTSDGREGGFKMPFFFSRRLSQRVRHRGYPYCGRLLEQQLLTCHQSISRHAFRRRGENTLDHNALDRTGEGKTSFFENPLVCLAASEGHK